jgi:hypothetical protein
MPSSATGGFHAVDNVGLLTRHHIEDAAAYERLGFTVCPLGRQHGPGADGALVRWGTGSRCINFARNGYLELMGVIEPELPTGSYAADLASRGPGPAKVTFGWIGSDLDAVAAAGVDTFGPITFTRTLPVAGRLATATIDLTVLDLGTAPLAMMAAAHHDPFVVRHPTTTSHPNGAIGIDHVRIAHPEPDALRRRLDRMGASGPLPGGGHLVVEHGRTPTITAVAVAVIDVESVIDLLRHNDVEHRLDGVGVTARPQHAGSAPIMFVPLGARSVPPC